MIEGHETPAPAASLGRDRCVFCHKMSLQHYGAGSIQCWWCGTIFPAGWLAEALRKIALKSDLRKEKPVK
jgi:hypothetical protein